MQAHASPTQRQCSTKSTIQRLMQANRNVHFLFSTFSFCTFLKKNTVCEFNSCVLLSSAPPPAVTPKLKRDDRCIAIGIDFGVIRAADFNNAIRFYVCRNTLRSSVTRHPPSHQNSKDMTDIWLWGRLWEFFGR